MIRTICLFFLLSTTALSQPLTDSLGILQQARGWMDTLCTPDFAGRGYVNNGHTLAAMYIAAKLNQMPGFEPGYSDGESSSFLQPVPLTVNVPYSASLSINGTQLTYGVDYIADGFASSGNGEGTIVDAGYGTHEELDKVKKGDVLLIDAAMPEGYEGKALSWMDKAIYLAKEGKRYKAIIILEDKLTATYAQDGLGLPVYHLLKSSLPNKPKQVTFALEAELQEDTQTQNVVAVLPGTSKSDTAIVLCAHYDHMGKVNDAIFYGGNDNASGVSFMLSLADYFARSERGEYTLIIIAFGAEEVALVGSNHYANNPCWPLERTKYVLDFDLMANGSDGIMTVAGNDYPQVYNPIKALNDEHQLITPLLARENRPISDHYPFTQKGVPALFFYTQGGPKHYHDIFDKPEAFQLDAFVNFRRLLISFMLGQ